RPLSAAAGSPAVGAACAPAPSFAGPRHFPGPQAALPGEDREWSLHRRGLYPLPWSPGLCGVVPARPRDVSLLCRWCSSPRSAVAGFLQPSPRGDALALDSELSSCMFLFMRVNLLQGTSTPLTHAHAGRTQTVPADA